MKTRSEYDIVTCDGVTFSTSSIFLEKAGYFRRLFDTDCSENETGRLELKQRADDFTTIHDLMIYDTEKVLQELRHSKEVNRAKLLQNMKYFQFDERHINTVHGWEPKGTCPCFLYVKMDATKKILEDKRALPVIARCFNDENLTEIADRAGVLPEVATIAADDNNFSLFEAVVRRSAAIHKHTSDNHSCWVNLLSYCIDKDRHKMALLIIATHPNIVTRKHVNRAVEVRIPHMPLLESLIHESGVSKQNLEQSLSKKDYNLFKYLASASKEAPDPGIMEQVLKVENTETRFDLIKVLIDAGIDTESTQFQKALADAPYLQSSIKMLVDLSVNICSTLIVQKCLPEDVIDMAKRQKFTVSRDCMLTAIDPDYFNQELLSHLLSIYDSDLDGLLLAAVRTLSFEAAKVLIAKGCNFFDTNWTDLIDCKMTSDTIDLLQTALVNTPPGPKMQSDILDMVTTVCKKDSSAATEIVKFLLSQEFQPVHVGADFLSACVNASISHSDPLLLLSVMSHWGSVTVTPSMFEDVITNKKQFLIIFLKDFLDESFVEDNVPGITSTMPFANCSEFESSLGRISSICIKRNLVDSQNIICKAFPQILRNNLTEAENILSSALSFDNDVLVKKILQFKFPCNITSTVITKYIDAPMENYRSKYGQPDIDLVKTVIAHYPKIKETINETTTKGLTPLSMSVYRSMPQFVELFLKMGADPEIGMPNNTGGGGRIPLVLYSIMNGEFRIQQQILKLLLEYGASASNKNEWECHPLSTDIVMATESCSYLQAALTRNNTAAVELLIEHGATTRLFADGSSPLHHVTTTDQVKLLSGSPIDIIYKGQTPISFAISKGRLDIAKELLMLGCDVSIPCKEGTTLLTQTLQMSFSGNTDAELLLEELIRLEAVPTHEDIEVLMQMVVEGKASIKLFENCIQIMGRAATLDTINPSTGQTVLTQAVGCRSFEVCDTDCQERFQNCVSIIVKHSSNPNIRNREGQTPLLRSMVRNNEITHILLESSKVNVNASLENGWSPLHAVIQTCDAPLCAQLLFRRANTEAVYHFSEGSYTPLGYLIQEFPSATNMFKLLIDHGANVNAKVNKNTYLLDLVCSCSEPTYIHVALYEQLKKKGALSKSPFTKAITKKSVDARMKKKEKKDKKKQT